MFSYRPNWEASFHDARLWQRLENDAVQCGLSPRHCKMRPGQAGFCGVRQNVNGRLVSLNYGQATHISQESVETEAVFHFAPGAPILSLGNVGCMLNCDYCQNWRTSQARYVSSADVHRYTPERVVEIAVERGIPIISWTYNDPVVWHEFVLDTSRIARARGIRALFKSAFFISLEAAAELCEVVDVFSISIKSLDEDFYRKITKGWLPPVLRATRLVFEQGKHVEISNLMVTDANDTTDDARRLAEWVLANLSASTPLHFARFHPDYKYTHVNRTPIERLEEARRAALEEGLLFAYLGNARDTESLNTQCPGCGHTLIVRTGTHAREVGLDALGRCANCQRKLEYVRLESAARPPAKKVGELRPAAPSRRLQRREFLWHGEINALHVEAHNLGLQRGHVSCRRLIDGNGAESGQSVEIGGQDSFRFMVSKFRPDENGVEIMAPEDFKLRIFEVYDRAHYPTVDLDTAQADQDQTPLPYYTRGGRGGLRR
ncbi:MAG: AmmeMemoRadiSam system radical SAM enzyme [Chloroflexi bacterium]|nr:AmmeMemoRadiSam system radical SAM enzyme [Chloroflexota bacterium]